MRSSHLRQSFHFKNLLVGLLVFLTGCATVPPVGTEQNRLVGRQLMPDEINWPRQYRPEEATFVVRSEIDIDAAAQVIWDVLVDAGRWTEYYSGASNFDMPSYPDGKLRPDSEFSWRTMGLNFKSNIHEFEEPYRLAWESRKNSIVGYHAWLIVPLSGGRSRLITEETQFGFLATMQGIFIPDTLNALHDAWLAEIKQRAEAIEESANSA